MREIILTAFIRWLALWFFVVLVALAIINAVDAAPLTQVSPLQSPLFYTTVSLLPTATATPPVESAVAVVSGGQQVVTLLPESGGTPWGIVLIAAGALLALWFLPRDDAG